MKNYLYSITKGLKVSVCVYKIFVFCLSKLCVCRSVLWVVCLGLCVLMLISPVSLLQTGQPARRPSAAPYGLPALELTTTQCVRVCVCVWIRACVCVCL